MNQVPTQTITVEPDQRLIDHAEERYEQSQTDLEREEYIERVVIELLRIELDTESW
jgi:hypothetical protein